MAPKSPNLTDQATQVVLAALDKCDLGDLDFSVTIDVPDTEEARLEKAMSVVQEALQTLSIDATVAIELHDRPPLTKADAVIEKALSRQVHLLKTTEEQYVLGVVLEPLKEMGMTDTQKDTYSALEVRQACHKFMEDYGTMGLQHQVNVSGLVKVVENTITRVDEVIDGEPVTAGTWLMGLRIRDAGLWKRVKNGEITGLSIGGVAQRTPLDLPQN